MRQRYDYLYSALQWFGAPLTVIFAALLVAGITAHALGFEPALRPLAGFFVAIPAFLLVTGVIRFIWALRSRLVASRRDVLIAFFILMALTWTVALACFKAMIQTRVAFLRTPKFKEKQSFIQALTATRAETPIALVLTGAAGAAAAAVRGMEAAFLAALAGWIAVVFWSAPVVAFAASRTTISSSSLRQRRDLESERERRSLYLRSTRYAVASAAVVALLFVLAGNTVVVPDDDGGTIDGIFSLPRQIEREEADGAAGPPVGTAGAAGPAANSSAPRVGTAGDTGGQSSGSGTRGTKDGGAGGGTGGDHAPDAAPAPKQTETAPAPQEPPEAAPAPAAKPTEAPAPAATPAPKPRATPDQASGSGSDRQPTDTPTPSGGAN